MLSRTACNKEGQGAEELQSYCDAVVALSGRGVYGCHGAPLQRLGMALLRVVSSSAGRRGTSDKRRTLPSLTLF